MTVDNEDLDLDRVRRMSALAQEYEALMGLAFVGVGVGFVLGAVMPQPAVWIALGSALGASSASWYHRRYGMVRAKRGRNVWLCVGSVAALVLILVGYVLDRWLSPPVSLSLLAVAASLAAGQYLMERRVGLTAAHWVVYALVVVAAFGPVAGFGVGGLLTPYVLLVAGLAAIAVGLLDHVRLVRMLSVDEAADDGH